jgi:hypothetical protein
VLKNELLQNQKKNHGLLKDLMQYAALTRVSDKEIDELKVISLPQQFMLSAPARMAPIAKRSVQHPSEEKENAIFIAIKNNNYTQIEEFVEQKANFTIRDNERKTGLHYWVASEKADERILHILKEKGLAIDDKNVREETPLYCAVMKSNIHAAIQLMYLGANVDKKFGRDNLTIFKLAIKKQLPLPFIEHFFPRAYDINQVVRADDFLPPLHLAALHGYEEAIQFFVNSRKADINFSEKSGWS